MKTIAIILFACSVLLQGCSDFEQKIPKKSEFVQYKENPVISYCGRDCSICHNREDECLRLLRENLTNLCDSTRQNCYEMWVKYARRCHQYCKG